MPTVFAYTYIIHKLLEMLKIQSTAIKVLYSNNKLMDMFIISVINKTSNNEGKA